MPYVHIGYSFAAPALPGFLRRSILSRSFISPPYSWRAVVPPNPVILSLLLLTSCGPVPENVLLLLSGYDWKGSYGCCNCLAWSYDSC